MSGVAATTSTRITGGGSIVTTIVTTVVMMTTEIVRKLIRNVYGVRPLSHSRNESSFCHVPASSRRAGFRRTAALLLGLVSIAGCGGEDPTDPEDPVAGIIQVAVSTSGP